MKFGAFDLEVRSIGHSEFFSLLLHKERILFNWGNFETKEAALSCGIQNCKKIFGAALNVTHESYFRIKSTIVNAVQWFPELKIEDIHLIGSRYYYKGVRIKRGDWVVDGSVVSNEIFKEKYECVE